MLRLFSTPSSPAQLEQMRQVALFSTLSDRELKIVSLLLHHRTILDGEIIFDEGEEGQAI